MSLGPFQVTLAGWFLVSLISAGCKIDSFYCNTQDDDGLGGSMEVITKCAMVVLAMPQALKHLVVLLYLVVASVGGAITLLPSMLPWVLYFKL